MALVRLIGDYSSPADQHVPSTTQQSSKNDSSGQAHVLKSSEVLNYVWTQLKWTEVTNWAWKKNNVFLNPDCCFSWLKTCYFFQNGPVVEVYRPKMFSVILTQPEYVFSSFLVHLWLSLFIHKGRQRGYKSWLYIEINFFPFLTFNCIEISTGGGGRPALQQLKWPRHTSGITLLSTRLIF